MRVIIGNEGDCICAKIRDKHTEYCDAYRLSQFFIKLASNVDDSWSVEEIIK